MTTTVPLVGAPRVALDGRVRGLDGIGRCTRSVESELRRRRRSGTPSLTTTVRNPYHPDSLTELVDFADAADSTIIHTFDYKTPLDSRGMHVVATVHDLIRIDHPELCYDDPAFVERFGREAFWGLTSSVAQLRGIEASPDSFYSRHHEYYVGMMRHTLLSADHVIFDSQTTMVRAHAFVRRQGTSSWHHLGVDSGKEQSAVLRGHDTIIYVGQDRPHKRVGNLLEAFRILRRRREGATLTLVGRDFDPQAPTEPGVRRLGAIDDGQLQQLLSQTRVLVQPSSYEGFGLTPLEAFANGASAVVADIPIFRETLGELAQFVDASSPAVISEGIERALATPDELSSARRAWAARYSWEAYVDHLVSIWTQVLGRAA